jgi:hypothetical protein
MRRSFLHLAVVSGLLLDVYAQSERTDFEAVAPIFESKLRYVSQWFQWRRYLGGPDLTVCRNTLSEFSQSAQSLNDKYLPGSESGVGQSQGV